MNRATKFLVLLLCASICAGGAIMSVREKAEDVRCKPNAMPIDNPSRHHRVWIWA